MSITLTGFIALFLGSLLGVECAAIFAIFTLQAWNMAFSLYQSLRTVPAELQEDIKLPGVGSYIAMAIAAKDMAAIGWAILGMLIGILLYDQLFFRPLLAWADKFRFEESGSESAPTSWLLTWLRRTVVLQKVGALPDVFLSRSFGWFRRDFDGSSIRARPQAVNPIWARAWDAVLAAAVMLALWRMGVFIFGEVGGQEVLHVFVLGFYTLARVLLLIAVASLIWVPVGVWIGLNPRIAGRTQALVQFLAAFSSNLVFPLAVMGIVHWKLDPDIWLSPLVILGTQRYVLFNVISGASAIPSELRLAADNLGLVGWLRWRRYLLPAIFPSFVTGAIKASGGSWNARIVAEYVNWGDTTLQAQGLGSYIQHMTTIGDFPRIALGIGVMCVFVMLLNHFVWRRLYRLAESRMHL